MSGRVRGYHYVRDPKTGRKRRVYARGSGGRSARRKTSGRSLFGTVYGRGAYYGRRARQPTVQRGAGPRGGRRANRGAGFLTLGFGGTDPPKMSMGKGGMVVSHREYIQDITSSVPFIGENFPLNPGMKQTFPWLSQIADNFEEWIPEAMIFEYKTTSSNTVVNTTNSNPGLGTVIMATQYNSLNNDFGNKQQMENYENAVSVDPSRSVVHGIECAKGQTPLQPMYVRTGDLSATSGVSNDLRFYDLGKMTIATVGQQTNNFVIGELWISYRVRFLKPRLQTGVGNNEQGNVDHFRLAGPQGVIAPVTAVVPARPFGTQTQLLAPAQGSTLGGVVSGGITVIADQLNIGFPSSLGGPHPFPIFAIANGRVVETQSNSVANTYYFPPGITSGIYLCQYSAEYSVAGSNNGQVVNNGDSINNQILTHGCHLLQAMGFDEATQLYDVNLVANDGTAGVTTDIVTFFIRVDTNYANFSMVSAGSTITTPVGGDLYVVQMPEAFVAQFE